MDVQTCSKCKKLFSYFAGPKLCSQCVKDLEELFQAVKEYIRENEYATIQDICKNTEASERQVMNWIREERLQFSKNSPITLNCRLCNEKITTGQLCEKCKKEMTNEFRSAYKVEPVEKKKDAKCKMRYI